MKFALIHKKIPTIDLVTATKKMLHKESNRQKQQRDPEKRMTIERIRDKLTFTVNRFWTWKYIKTPEWTTRTKTK